MKCSQGLVTNHQKVPLEVNYLFVFSQERKHYKANCMSNEKRTFLLGGFVQLRKLIS